MAKYKSGDKVGPYNVIFIEYIESLTDSSGRKIKQARFFDPLFQDEFTATVLSVKSGDIVPPSRKKINISKIHESDDKKIKQNFLFVGDGKINSYKCKIDFISDWDRQFFTECYNIIFEIMKKDIFVGQEFIITCWNFYYNYNKTWQWILLALQQKTITQWVNHGVGLFYFKNFIGEINKKEESLIKNVAL